MKAWDSIAIAVAIIIVLGGALTAILKTAELQTDKIEEKDQHNEPSPTSSPPYYESEMSNPHCGPVGWFLTKRDGKLQNCSFLSHKECDTEKIVTYEGTCDDAECTVKPVVSAGCTNCKKVEQFWGRKDAICLQNPESNILVLICGRDNEENKCSPYIEKHTYIFDSPKHIGNAEIRYKTGFGFNCPSKVNVYIVDEDDERILVTTLTGVGHKMLMASLDLSKYGKIKGIVLDEGGDCYLDRSALILEILPE